MCLMCVYIEKDKLSVSEIARALSEVEDNHIEEVLNKLEDKNILDEVREEYLNETLK